MTNPLLRICVTGDQVGKTRLIMRYVRDDFEYEHDPTLYDNHRKKTKIDDQDVTLDLIDISGSDDYVSIYPQWFKNVDGFILLYSINNTRSFDLIPIIRDRIMNAKTQKDYSMLLVGTSTDDEKNRKITSMEGKSLAYTLSCPFLEVSSLTGDGVENAFAEIVREIRERKKEEELESKNKIEVPDTIENPIKEGALKKKGGANSGKIWCALKEGIMYLYKIKGNAKIFKEKISLLTCTPKPSESNKNGFDLVSITETYKFISDTKEDMMDWIMLIQNEIAGLLNQVQSDKEKSMLKSDRDESDRIVPIEEIRKFPENLECCDCGAKVKKSNKKKFSKNKIFKIGKF
eukprot:Anaeramoba_ignava/c21006_g1_i5.p1 GENE.c21006_g1_i5~~c21006_g1_i5.p1  ORF type:complete len:346 (+),score=112.20 c21006_g1_i5:41-1078(+)